ncbi:transcriptional regulator FtsR [Corynebacterium kozikiae]|uniref:transcriptional regulator FtsR n=1 Tax=Corynebacterium kozikiae TaxID=2968469 RepID=UPI00211C878B|nr:MerR family transcriptional regulator [Corynebacterium sp. 76QC2CO]MCQ9343853.1 MerR family transcriptional regulator [Corynebacterium sp. 76QC2CO]
MGAVPQKATPASAGASRAVIPAKAPKTMAIGVVLQQLTAEFPDVTVSKIRFLESEGLISPQRTASGYRRFTQADVDRLRFILTTQRDAYLPLKVIREQLEAMDSGLVTAITPQVEPSAPVVSPEKFRGTAGATRLSEADLAARAEITVEQVRALAKGGVIDADASGYFDAEDAQTAALAVQLEAFGIDTRHLKNLRNTAARQADLVTRAVKPLAHQKGEGAKHEARELSQQVSALMVSLHANLLKAELKDELGS